MRVSKIFAVIATVLPVISTYVAPPARSGTTSIDLGVVTITTAVPSSPTGTPLANTLCHEGILGSSKNDHRTGCTPSSLVSPLSAVPPVPHKPSSNHTSVLTCNVVGEQRCVIRPDWIVEECSPQLKWRQRKICNYDEVCSSDQGRAQCASMAPAPLYADKILESCENGKYRCNGARRIDVCKNHIWNHLIDCPAPFACRDNNPFCFNPERAPPIGPTLCSPGDHRCSEDYHVLSKCDDDHVFRVKKKCAAPGDCKIDGPGQAHCKDDGYRSPPKSRGTQDVCAIPGEQKCSADNYVLYKCGWDLVYHLEKKCTTPGDCKVDKLGHAHCVRGGIDPPMLGRASQQCTPGDRACDSERRFLFHCTDDGEWSEGHQCFRAGACAINTFYNDLACIGFPTFEYPADDERVCETEKSCEFEGFLYCSAGTNKPEDIAKCLRGMCSDKECADCDRCTYKNRYGGTKPDLSTLWSPPRDV